MRWESRALCVTKVTPAVRQDAATNTLGACAVAESEPAAGVDTEAQLIAVPLRCGVQVERLDLDAVANDVIFGLMGVSVRR